MDYEKLHKDTIAKLQEMVNSGKITVKTACGICADFVPESEDERIRNFLIKQANSVLDSITDDDEEVTACKSALAWLEKQGNLMKALQISNSRIAELVEEKYNLEEKLKKQGEQKTADVRTTGYWHVEDVEQKPADKVGQGQEELTEFEKAVKQVMEEAIECGDIHNLKADADMLLRLVQKPWSEEDREMSRFIGNAITVNDASIYLESKGIQVIDAHVWLEELKERVQPQSHWRPSYEQVSVLEFVMNDIEKDSIRYRILNSVLEQLKKLRDEDV